LTDAHCTQMFPLSASWYSQPQTPAVRILCVTSPRW